MRGGSPFQDMAKGREVHRFREKHIEAGVASALLIGGGKISADCDRRQSRPAMPRFCDQFVPVTVRKANVADNNVDFAFVQKFQSRRRGVSCRNLVPPASENGGERLLRIIVVLDQQDRAEGMEISRHICSSGHNGLMVGFNPTAV